MASAHSAHAVPSQQSPTLFIIGLDKSISDEQLSEGILTGAGIRPISVRVLLDMNTQQSRGLAYANFSSLADAATVLDKLRFGPINGAKCRMVWCQHDPSARRKNPGLFFKNLPMSITEEYLCQASIALLESNKIPASVMDVRILGTTKHKTRFAAIFFSSADAATCVRNALNGLEAEGQRIEVVDYTRQPKRPRDMWTNLYVKRIPLSWNDDKLATIFAPFGNVKEHKVVTDEQGASKGFGFVCMSTHAEAERAIQELNGKVFDEHRTAAAAAAASKDASGSAASSEGAGVGATTAGSAGPDAKETYVPGLYVGPAKTMKERRAEVTRKRAERAEKSAQVTVYVRGFPDTVSDDDLRERFKQYGSITSAKVAKDESNYSRQFGFVSFSTSSEADAATAENKKQWSGKVLHVERFQPKAIRTKKYEEKQKQLRSKPAATTAAAAPAASAAAAGTGPNAAVAPGAFNLGNIPPAQMMQMFMQVFAQWMGQSMYRGMAGGANPAAALMGAAAPTAPVAPSAVAPQQAAPTSGAAASAVAGVPPAVMSVFQTMKTMPQTEQQQYVGSYVFSRLTEAINEKRLPAMEPSLKNRIVGVLINNLTTNSGPLFQVLSNETNFVNTVQKIATSIQNAASAAAPTGGVPTGPQPVASRA